MKQSTPLPEGDRIVPMQQADLAVVHQLECDSQQDSWSLQHFADELDNPASTVDLYWCPGEYQSPGGYQRQGQLAGFLFSWQIADELQIQNLATLPAMRRRGIAVRLLEHAIARSRTTGLASIWLEVRDSNTAAISLYNRFGFSACGKRSGYYPDGEDALIMSYIAKML
ncbi:MAG: ribosomal protein S18-alanine N-acetyltransferase [Deltaproteobacteria bacterium]|nr:ribosomal protein S18-alanine N-acetyltransferase [Deltaproteobacteria bacterium]